MALPNILQIIERLRLYLVPGGFIGMWSGSAETIPTGWALCDGTNGTPDLTERFILGAGKGYTPGTTGGAKTATPSVAAGSAKTGIGLGTAAPGGTAGSSGTGIAVQGAALSIWTGAAGTGIGILVLILELFKGFFPVFLAARALNLHHPMFAFVLAAPVMGHAFPLSMKFQGGKSIAVSFGVLLGLSLIHI